MDLKYMIFIAVIFVYTRDVSVECKTVHTITLYTDLVDIIGKDTSCEGRTREINTTEKEDLYSKQGVVISNYKFRDVDVRKTAIGKCDVTNIQSQSYSQYNWTCFATENSTSRNTNWFFVDCVNFEILTIRCLELREVTSIIDNLCKRKDQREDNFCHDFSYAGKEENYAVCSQNFRLRRIIHDSIENTTSFTTVGDIAAYLCVAFILVTFLLAVLIPAEKCKPTYKYEQERRVPLEIYEMYGVNYGPAAKRKSKRKSLHRGSIPAIASHMGNLAVVANNPVDWKGHKTKFNFHQLQPIFNPMINGLGENNKESERDLRNNKTVTFDGRKGSADSVGTVGTFDYSLFQNQIEEGGQNITSERKQSSSGNTRSNSLLSEERRNTYRKGRKTSHGSYSENMTEQEGDLDKQNDEYVAQWLGNNTRVDDDNSSVGSTDYEAKVDRNSQIEPFSNRKTSIQSNTYNEYNDTIDEGKEGSINSDSFENNIKEIIETSDDDFASADIEQYERQEKSLKQNYNVKKNGTPCECNRRASFSHDTISEEDKAVVKLETISECQSTILSDVDENSINVLVCPNCCRNIPNVEANVTQDNSRPRISITVELPNNFPVGKTQPVVTHVPIKQETRTRITTRSLSTENAIIDNISAKPKRKYSLC